MNSATGCGKERRLRRLFSQPSGKILIVPLDDSLLAGPELGLENIGAKAMLIAEGKPDAVVGFRGLFIHQAAVLQKTPGILNLTVSTTLTQHTRKQLFGSVEEAAQMGLEGVAVHVNMTSRYEPEMLRILGQVVREAEAWGLPVLAHMYVRREAGARDDNYETVKHRSPDKYAKLVAHAARVGVEAGASIIKTHYTGGLDSFRRVVEASAPVPVVIAGGPPLATHLILEMAETAMGAGAGGISFGRNVFSRADPRPMIRALRSIVHENASAKTAAKLMRLPISTQPL